MKNITITLLILCTALVSYTQAIHNPVLNSDFPDPTVIKATDGKFYAYATQTKLNGKWINIQVATSADGYSWKVTGDALPTKPGWASHTQDFWAPHVMYDAGMKKYVMFYSAESDDTATTKCLGVAFSDAPQGPFIDKGSPLITGKGFVNIDPMLLIDPLSHKKLLYWGSGFKPIKVQEMNDDLQGFKAGTAAADLVYPNKDTAYSHLVEGAWVDYNDGKYYLYYSGDNCCVNTINYAVMVARADNPFGPFTRLSETTGTQNSAIVEKDEIWTAPGHNSLFRDNKGTLWMAYHAVKLDDYNAHKPFKRVMCINPVIYKNGWPVLEKKY